MRTLAIAFLLSLGAAACEGDKKPAEPPAATEPSGPAKPTSAPGEVRQMTPTEVKKEVERAGEEHGNKIDQALEVE